MINIQFTPFSVAHDWAARPRPPHPHLRRTLKRLLLRRWVDCEFVAIPATSKFVAPDNLYSPCKMDSWEWREREKAEPAISARDDKMRRRRRGMRFPLKELEINEVCG